MAPMEDKPEEGEAYDSDLEGQSVRLPSGRTGTVMCRACHVTDRMKSKWTIQENATHSPVSILM